MKEERGAAESLTKEDIRRAAVLALYTYDGATAAEWQDQADTLREGNGGEVADNADASLSQMIADALREMDEGLAERSSRQ
jgi:uncharacterized protein YaeQ